MEKRIKVSEFQEDQQWGFCPFCVGMPLCPLSLTEVAVLKIRQKALQGDEAFYSTQVTSDKPKSLIHNALALQNNGMR